MPTKKTPYIEKKIWIVVIRGTGEQIHFYSKLRGVPLTEAIITHLKHADWDYLQQHTGPSIEI